jgi:ribonuclease P protein component
VIRLCDRVGPTVSVARGRSFCRQSDAANQEVAPVIQRMPLASPDDPRPEVGGSESPLRRPDRLDQGQKDPKVHRPGESLGREYRMRRRAEYQRCYQFGTKIHGPFLTLFLLSNEREHSRVGVTATRRIGNSVVRHRARRLVKEIFRRSPQRWKLPAIDLVFHLKPRIVEAEFGELVESVDRQLRRAYRLAAASNPSPRSAP